MPAGTRNPRMRSSALAHTTATPAAAAVGDPHLRAVQHPAVAVAPRGRAHRAQGRCRRRARSARSSRSPPRRPCARASAPSAPATRSCGSRTSRASPAPTRGCAGRCRRPRARGRRGRRRSRSRPRSRSPRDACRAAPARRARGPAPAGRPPARQASFTIGRKRRRDPVAHGRRDQLLLARVLAAEAEGIIHRVAHRGSYSIASLSGPARRPAAASHARSVVAVSAERRAARAGSAPASRRARSGSRPA